MRDEVKEVGRGVSAIQMSPSPRMGVPCHFICIEIDRGCFTRPDPSNLCALLVDIIMYRLQSRLTRYSQRNFPDHQMARRA